MRDHPSNRPLSIVNRAARVAFTFLVMNWAAVAGVFVAFGTKSRQKVWR